MGVVFPAVERGEVSILFRFVLLLGWNVLDCWQYKALSYKQTSFGRPVRRRPPVELDARVGRHADPGAQVLRLPLLLQMVIY